MARKRMIAPNIWESQSFNRLSMTARMLFIGLFSNADDEGRGVAHPARLRSTIFPYDDMLIDAISSAMDECAAQVGIRFYEVDGDRFYQLDNWLKWQRIDKPTPSILPPPPCEDSNSPNDLGALAEPSPSNLGAVPPNIIKGNISKEKITEQRAREKSADNPPRHTAQDARFEEFWSAYPKRVGRGAALKAYRRIKVTDDLHRKMLTAIKAAQRSEQWRRDGGQFIPNPATWLNQERWDDECCANVSRVTTPTDPSINPFRR